MSGAPRKANVPDILDGQTILITGGAGLVGSVLLYRLLTSPFRPKRIITVVRGPKASSRLPTDLQRYIANLPGSVCDISKLLIVIQGDCSKREFGVTDKQELEWLRDVDIVINGASDVRFNMPFEHAIRTNVAMSYAVAEFVACTPSVKTCLYLSSCFMGFFLPSGSTFIEMSISNFLGDKIQPINNTYIHSKAVAESITESFSRSVVKTKWAIVRISAVSPAISFPYPAYGADGASSPVCAWIGAPHIPDPYFRNFKSKDGYDLDFIPVDVCVDQILALAARTHQIGQLGHKESGELLFSLADSIAVYHVAHPENVIPVDDVNSPSFKMKSPFIPIQALLRAYGHYIKKNIRFSNAKAKAAMHELDLEGLRVEAVQGEGMDVFRDRYFGAIKRAMEEHRARKLLATNTSKANL